MSPHVHDGATTEAWSFDREEIVALGRARAAAYAAARPFRMS